MKARIVLHLILSFILVGVCSSLASASGGGQVSTSAAEPPQFAPAPVIDPAANLPDFGGGSVPPQTESGNGSISANESEPQLSPETQQFANESNIKTQNDIAPAIEML